MICQQIELSCTSTRISCNEEIFRVINFIKLRLDIWQHFYNIEIPIYLLIYDWVLSQHIIRFTCQVKKLLKIIEFEWIHAAEMQIIQNREKISLIKRWGIKNIKSNNLVIVWFLSFHNFVGSVWILLGNWRTRFGIRSTRLTQEI